MLLTVLNFNRSRAGPVSLQVHQYLSGVGGGRLGPASALPDVHQLGGPVLGEAARLEARIRRRKHLELHLIGAALAARPPLLLRLRAQVRLALAVRAERPRVGRARVHRRADDHRIRLLRRGARPEVHRLPLLHLRAARLLALVLRSQRGVLGAAGPRHGPGHLRLLALARRDEELLLHLRERAPTRVDEPKAVVALAGKRAVAILQAVVQAPLRPTIAQPAL